MSRIFTSNVAPHEKARNQETEDVNSYGGFSTFAPLGPESAYFAAVLKCMQG